LGLIYDFFPVLIENAMGNMGMTVNQLESYPFRKQNQATVPVMVISMFRVRGRLS